MLRFALCAALLLLINQSARANEPKKPDVEKLPAPKVQVEPAITIVPYVPRTDTIEVWQHYGVNRMGRFVPRVIVTQHGAYYSRNLQPYPWTQNRSSAVLPSKVD